MEILLVDDERHILQVIGDFLTDCGYRVCTADDGAQALEVLEERGDVGLIVSDIRMPRLDGLGLLRTVRVRFPGMPVVLMTGHGDEGVAVAALHEGAHDYLKKPIKLSEFLDCIELLESRSRLESEYRRGEEGAPASGTEGRREEAGSEAAAASAGDASAATGSVLVIDPDSAQRSTQQRLLREWGHRVVAVDSGTEGLQRFVGGMFDVIVTEIDLADMDGVELIRRLRASDPTVMPIALTVREDRETAVRVLEEGGRGFLVKPFSPEALRQRVVRALQERQRLIDTRLLLGDLLHTRADLQEKVAERERFLRLLIDAAPFGILSTDEQGKILTFNGRAEQMYGFGQEEIVGSDLERLSAPGEEAAPDLEASAVVKTRHRRRDGEIFPVVVHHRRVLDPRGRLIARLQVVEDLSERERMEAQLFYAERLSLLGQLAPRIAHEYKTPLQAIIGQVEMALLELQDRNHQAVREYLEGIMPATQQMMDLSQQMATLGRPVERREEEFDMREELESALDNLKNLGVVKHCRIRQEFGTAPMRIYGDPSQIQQVFRNLIVNAAQAMEEWTPRELQLGLRRIDGGVELTVRDSGPGIPQENLEQIFQPFFTTKLEGKGTGLGLAIVRTIVDRHCGWLEVESEEGKGACFRLSFPQQKPGAADWAVTGSDDPVLSPSLHRQGIPPFSGDDFSPCCPSFHQV